MAVGVNIEIAKTHLLAKKRQTFVAMLGVTFGIGMYILMIGFMTGFNEFLQDTLLSSTPDVRIYNDIKTDYTHMVINEVIDSTKSIAVVHHPRPKDINPNIKNAAQILDDLKRDTRVASIAPQLSTQVFFNNGPVQINGTLSGVNILEEAKLSGLSEKMKTGKIENLLTQDNGIMLGQSLANILNVSIGDLVTLSSPKGTTMRFRVVGTFQFGLGAIDKVRGYVSLSKVQQLLGKDNQYITEINLKLKDYTKSEQVAKEFGTKYGYKSDNWETSNSSAMASILIRNVMTIVVSLTLLIVAGFGIYNIMSMTIQNKLKDIAILKAQGFAGKDIRQIFLTESIIIGFFGAMLGLLLGYILSTIVFNLPFPKTDFMAITHYPVTFHWYHYVFGVVFGMVTTFIAGLIPSMNASKVDPVVILRG